MSAASSEPTTNVVEDSTTVQQDRMDVDTSASTALPVDVPAEEPTPAADVAALASEHSHETSLPHTDSTERMDTASALSEQSAPQEQPVSAVIEEHGEISNIVSEEALGLDETHGTGLKRKTTEPTAETEADEQDLPAAKRRKTPDSPSAGDQQPGPSEPVSASEPLAPAEPDAMQVEKTDVGVPSASVINEEPGGHTGAVAAPAAPSTAEDVQKKLEMLKQLNAKLKSIHTIQKLKIVTNTTPSPAGDAAPPSATAVPPAAKKKMPTLRFSTGPASATQQQAPPQYAPYTPATVPAPVPTVAASRTPRSRAPINYADIEAGPADDAALDPALAFSSGSNHAGAASRQRNKSGGNAAGASPVVVAAPAAAVGSVSSGRQRRRSTATDSGVAGAYAGGYAPSSAAALEAARRLVEELQNHEVAGPFLDAVDWRAMGLDDYPRIIKHPMDLGTIHQRLEQGEYISVQQVADDVRLVCQNALTYNAAGSQICIMAQTLATYFEQRFPGVLAAEADTTPPNPKKRQLNDTIRELREHSNALMAQLAELRKQGVTGATASGAAASGSKKKGSSSRSGASNAKKWGPRFYKDLSYEEKAALSDRINDLPAQHLAGVVAIVEEEAPHAVSNPDNIEIELDIDALPTLLLRRLEDYVRSVLGSVAVNVDAPTRPSTSHATTQATHRASTPSPASPASVTAAGGAPQASKPARQKKSGGGQSHAQQPSHARRRSGASSDSNSSSDSDSDSELSEVAAASHMLTPDPVTPTPTPTTPAPSGPPEPVTLKNAATWSQLEGGNTSLAGSSGHSGAASSGAVSPSAGSTASGDGATGSPHHSALPPVSPGAVPPVSPGGASADGAAGQGALWSQFHHRGIQKQQKERDKAEMEERLRREKEEKERKQQEEELRRKKEEEERERARLEQEAEQKRQQEEDIRRMREEARRAREQQTGSIDMMSQIVEMSSFESSLRNNNGANQ